MLQQGSQDVLLPWQDASILPILQGKDKLPNNNSDLWEYFDGANPRMEGGNLYVGMRIGTTMPLHKLIDCFQFYLKKNPNVAMQNTMRKNK